MFSKDLFIKKDKDYKKYILYQKLARELAFLPEAKQKDYLKELIRIYRQMLKGY